MSDLTVNATDIKCRVYVAKFLCAQCLCLHGKLLFLCVSGTNISSWIGEVLFMCWQCLMERRWRMSFSATNHAPTKVGAFFFYIFFPPDLYECRCSHIFVCIVWIALQDYRQFNFSQFLTFCFHSFTHNHFSFYTFLLILDLRILSKMTNVAFPGSQTQNLGVATAWAAGTLQEC